MQNELLYAEPNNRTKENLYQSGRVIAAHVKETTPLQKTQKARAVWFTVALVILTMLVSALPASAQTRDLFNDTNIYGVLNGPYYPTQFTLSSPATITQLITYHWYFGRGATPGNIRLVNNQSGQAFGPFAAVGTSGQGGAPNVNWIATVNVPVPAGTYTVLDSSPSTWSHNAQSGYRGFAIVRGTPLTSPPAAADKGGNNPNNATPVYLIANSIDFPSAGIINDQVSSADPQDWYSFMLNQPAFTYSRNLMIVLNGVPANATVSLFRSTGSGLQTIPGVRQQVSGSAITLTGYVDVYYAYPYKWTYYVVVTSTNGVPTPYMLSIQAQ